MKNYFSPRMTDGVINSHRPYSVDDTKRFHWVRGTNGDV